MKRWITVIVFCLAASLFGTSLGLAQEASPSSDSSVPEGAIANDSRVFFKDGLQDVETVEFIIMTNWEMDSATSAERFFDELATSIPTDMTVRTSDAQLEHLTDDQLLITGEDQFGGPVTVILFRQGTVFGTWMAVGDVGQDHLLANLFNQFFANGFDPSNPLPSATDLPEGYASAGV